VFNTRDLFPGIIFSPKNILKHLATQNINPYAQQLGSSMSYKRQEVKGTKGVSNPLPPWCSRMGGLGDGHHRKELLPLRD
jgi:hypothetical protein